MLRRNPEVVVVTGASAGVGRATARAFARRGAKLGLLARGGEGLERAQEEAGQAVAIPTDVADADSVEQAAGLIEEELGPIDVWVNNAMATVFSPFGALSAEEFRAAKVHSRRARSGWSTRSRAWGGWTRLPP